jgi:transposase InsO family protein
MTEATTILTRAGIERLMRENDIRAQHKRRFKVTTDSKHSLPIAPNRIWTTKVDP